MCSPTEHENELCDFCTGLAAETDASGSYGGRSRPSSVGEPGDDHTGASSGRKDEASFNHGEDGKASC